jgi:FlaA1/EpsC-like NDP-sugar epimerase
MIGADAFAVAASLYLSYLIRFELLIPAADLARYFHLLPLVLVIKMWSFGLFRLYRGMWRYTGLVDVANVGKAVCLSSFLIIFWVLMLYRFQGYPRSVFLIDGILTFLAVGGLRVAIRIWYARGLDLHHLLPRIPRRQDQKSRLLIIGAGNAGEKVLRELQDNPHLKFQAVGFLDDDLRKQGKTIHGIPVVGTVEEIQRISIEFDEILIAIPSAKGRQMRRIVAACERTGKRFRTLPGIGELIDGSVSVKTMRQVNLLDLMGREEVLLDRDEIALCLRNKRVLVTGAGGSIGSELVRQMTRFQPQAVGLVEMSEFNLFKLNVEFCQRLANFNSRSFLADIRNKEAMKRIFTEFRPDVVFHAAAYKHVDIQEIHPWEAVLNNVLGTRNLVQVSLESGVERFVLVSTDKAVRPASVMGATKRVAEMLIEAANQLNGTRFMAVRFGNVIASSGSVIPVFQEQISQGRPVTVTHPEVTRYFMSIPEASQLILQAGAMGEGGEIFILEMGKPVRIADLARDLIRLNGLEPEVDIPIQYIGLRPGEKLVEELRTDGEDLVPTNHEKIMVLRGNSHNGRELDVHIEMLVAAARSCDAAAIKKLLKEIVPEYNSRN